MSTGTLHMPDETGDTRLQWDADNPDEVGAAKKKYEELHRSGFAAYRVKRGGGEELIHGFDEKAERIIMRPPMVGG